MRVEDIMTKEVSSCSPGTNAAAAAEIMWNKDCGSVPIIEDGGRIVGIVTDRDLFIALGTRNQRAADLPVSEIMNHEVLICSPEDDLRVALKTMAQERVHRLPVVDQDGALQGILSIDDVVSRAESDGLSKEVLRTMKALCERPNRTTTAA